MLAPFVAALHPSPSIRAVIRFVALKPRTEPVTLWQWTPGIPERLLELNAQGYNAFVQVNPCATLSGGGVENVAHVSALPMDIDTEKCGYALQTVIDLFARIGIPASAAVSSGGSGGHLYLFLDRPYSVAEAAAVARRVCFCSFGDAVHNPNRIMRLPGTWNWKSPPRPCMLLGLDSTRRYSLAQITAALDAAHAPDIDEPEPLDEVPMPTIGAQALVDGLAEPWRTIVTTGNSPAGWIDMSALDWAVICNLIEGGATDEQVCEIYNLFPIRRLKVATAGEGYFERTIRRARQAVSAEIRRRSGIPLWVAESEGLYFVEGGHVRLDREAARKVLKAADDRLIEISN